MKLQLETNIIKSNNNYTKLAIVIFHCLYIIKNPFVQFLVGILGRLTPCSISTKIVSKLQLDNTIFINFLRVMRVIRV